MLAWIEAHGGFMLLTALAVTLFNIVMSAIAQIFAALKRQEPQWLQNIGNWGLKISQWLSANTPTPAPAQPVVPPQDQKSQ
jgi:hypothetical protein